MNIILLSKYSRLGASSRLRSLQYLPLLEQAGIAVTHFPLFDDEYLQRLNKGDGRSSTAVMRRYVNRAWRLRQLGNADLIWLEKEALPYVPHWLERILMPAGIPYVVDYDDAVFHHYDLSHRRLVRALLGKKIDRIMKEATTVLCGNAYLAARAHQAGARHVEHLPTVVDASRYASGQAAGQGKTPLIGWIGAPTTQHYVLALKPVVEKLCRESHVKVVLVGAQPSFVKQWGDVPIDILPWSEATEAQIIASFDIGIMPLPSGPWERGKCGYKLIQYMACGKPVIASPVGVNVEIVNGWQCGKLAGNPKEWHAALQALLGDVALRHAMGEQGRQAVEQHFSLQAQAPRLVEILRSAANRGCAKGTGNCLECR